MIPAQAEEADFHDQKPTPPAVFTGEDGVLAATFEADARLYKVRALTLGEYAAKGKKPPGRLTRVGPSGKPLLLVVLCCGRGRLEQAYQEEDPDVWVLRLDRDPRTEATMVVDAGDNNVVLRDLMFLLEEFEVVGVWASPQCSWCPRGNYWTPASSWIERRPAGPGAARARSTVTRPARSPWARSSAR